MVPDLKIALTVGGQTKPVLHEIKVISCSQSRYSPTCSQRAVDRRASNLNQGYILKARKVENSREV